MSDDKKDTKQSEQVEQKEKLDDEWPSARLMVRQFQQKEDKE